MICAGTGGATAGSCSFAVTFFFFLATFFFATGGFCGTGVCGTLCCAHIPPEIIASRHAVAIACLITGLAPQLMPMILSRSALRMHPVGAVPVCVSAFPASQSVAFAARSTQSEHLYSPIRHLFCLGSAYLASLIGLYRWPESFAELGRRMYSVGDLVP